ncbi:MAG: penicillin-binding protein 2 [Gammaproteobacteria bacterium]|nr:penicillin-binding protein 2 [Gammaproteobacteria bacterium]
MSQTTLRDYLSESRLFSLRTVVAAIIVIVLLIILVVRLLNLQIIKHGHYTTLSRDNRVKVQPVPPTRGLIYDRNGVLLAQNLPAHSLELIPEKVESLEATLSTLGEIIEISEYDLNHFHRMRKQHRRFKSIPLKVRLNQEEVARLAVNLHRFPGVNIHAKLLRDYPLRDKTAHVLGYVGRINENELKRIDPTAYAGTSYIGKNGVEKTYEEQLHGQVGYRQVEVNALGRTIRVLENRPPVQGRDLHLSLDSTLQTVGMEAFGDENGAAVAIDPQTGELLALISNPGFNPNEFVEGISSSSYKALQSSDNKPLFNRALRGQYPPGSTIKPFIGLAGLETGITTFEKSTYCPGFFQLPNHSHRYRDWKKGGHGRMDMQASIVQSCDVYFYDLAFHIGIDKLQTFLGQFGFGSRTGVDITGESPGLLPSREWKRKKRNQPWYPGETLITGIGQGYFLTTPLQLASATATLSTRGAKTPPHIVQWQQGVSDSEPVTPPPPLTQSIPINASGNWDDIIYAMTQVIEGARGTARRIHNDQYSIAGKTGTAQVFTVKQDEEYDEETVAKKMKDHALFITFAPVEEPKIAIAVIVENGGHGGSIAAPIASAMMDYYLLGNKPTKVQE